MSKSRLLKVFIYLLLCAGAFTMLVPFLWMVSTSLMTEQEIYQYPPPILPERPIWHNYRNALTALPFGRFFFNTAVMSFGVALGQVALCSLAAYAFARLSFRGQHTLFIIYLGSMMIPTIVTVIPRFLVVQALEGMNTYWALIVPSINSAWGTFLMRQFFLTIPRSFDEAAKLDGASNLTILLRIIMPLSKPALATLGLFSFMWTWQSFLWPLIVTDRMNMRPVEVGISMFRGLYSQNWPYQMAAAVTVMLPILVIFLLAQRYFIRGIALSGLKR